MAAFSFPPLEEVLLVVLLVKMVPTRHFGTSQTPVVPRLTSVSNSFMRYMD